MKPYLFNEADRRLAIQSAAARVEFNARELSKDKKVCYDKSTYQANLEGNIGEIVLGKFLQIEPKLLKPKEDVAGSVDFVTPEGKTVDAKFTQHPGGNLLVPLDDKPGKCDAYFLIAGNVNEWVFHLLGFNLGLNIIDPNNVKDLPYGPCYLWPRDKLIEPQRWGYYATRYTTF